MVERQNAAGAYSSCVFAYEIVVWARCHSNFNFIQNLILFLIDFMQPKLNLGRAEVSHIWRWEWLQSPYISLFNYSDTILISVRGDAACSAQGAHIVRFLKNGKMKIATTQKWRINMDSPKVDHFHPFSTVFTKNLDDVARPLRRQPRSLVSCAGGSFARPRRLW